MDVAPWRNRDGQRRARSRVPVQHGDTNHDAASAHCGFHHEPPNRWPCAAARGDAPEGDSRHLDDRRYHSESRTRQGRVDIRPGVAPDGDRDRHGRTLESSLRKCTMDTMDEKAGHVSCKDTEDCRTARVCGLVPTGKISQRGLTASTQALHIGAGHPEHDAGAGDPRVAGGTRRDASVHTGVRPDCTEHCRHSAGEARMLPN